MVDRYQRKVICFTWGSRLPFDFRSLDEGVGASQGSVIRIAEALAESGCRVWVTHEAREENYISPAGVKYANTCPVVPEIQIDVRQIQNHRSPETKKKIFWMHDRIDGKLRPDGPFGNGKYTHVVCCGSLQLRGAACMGVPAGMEQLVIANPVDLVGDGPSHALNDSFSLLSTTAKIDLGMAISVLRQLRKKDDRWLLRICHPSWRKFSHPDEPGLEMLGSRPHKQVLTMIGESFSGLMPSREIETFGCSYAEFLARGVPVLTSYVEGSEVNEYIPKSWILPEDSKAENYAATLQEWKNRGRPDVERSGNMERVVSRWKDLLEIDD